jgi:ABC-type molybdate transport system ATPase subunit
MASDVSDELLRLDGLVVGGRGRIVVLLVDEYESSSLLERFPAKVWSVVGVNGLIEVAIECATFIGAVINKWGQMALESEDEGNSSEFTAAFI